jgi:hypothetical protein
MQWSRAQLENLGATFTTLYQGSEIEYDYLMSRCPIKNFGPSKIKQAIEERIKYGSSLAHYKRDPGLDLFVAMIDAARKML